MLNKEEIKKLETKNCVIRINELAILWSTEPAIIENEDHRNIEIQFSAYRCDTRIPTRIVILEHAEKGIDRAELIQKIRDAVETYTESIRLDMLNLINKAI